MPSIPESARAKRPIRTVFKKEDAQKLDAPYRTGAWFKFTKRMRLYQPLCQGCFAYHRISPSELTDHVFPWKPDIEKFWKNKFQVLCKRCHHQKSINEHKQRFDYYYKGEHYQLRAEDYYDIVIAQREPDPNRKVNGKRT